MPSDNVKNAAESGQHSEAGDNESTPHNIYGKALTQVIKNLKDQPTLIFALGIAIILVGAGVWGLENQRFIMAPLLVILIVGLTAYLFLEIRKTSQKLQPKSRITGDINAEIERADNGIEAQTGSINAAGDSDRAETGSIDIQVAELKGGGKLTTGSIKKH